MVGVGEDGLRRARWVRLLVGCLLLFLRFQTRWRSWRRVPLGEIEGRLNSLRAQVCVHGSDRCMRPSLNTGWVPFYRQRITIWRYQPCHQPQPCHRILLRPRQRPCQTSCDSQDPRKLLRVSRVPCSVCRHRQGASVCDRKQRGGRYLPKSLGQAGGTGKGLGRKTEIRSTLRSTRGKKSSHEPTSLTGNVQNVDLLDQKNVGPNSLRLLWRTSSETNKQDTRVRRGTFETRFDLPDHVV